ncbi:MAG: pilus assembly protein PilM [Planctomycetes bacterium]|nr:pilus assembly protein PilM [Planctomycetota bacterium]
MVYFNINIMTNIKTIIGRCLALAQFNKISTKRPSDLVSVDFDHTGVNCVRMRRTGEGVAILAADVLPPVEIGKDASQTTEKRSSFHLPKDLVARYVSICIPTDEAVVKLLNLPGQLEGDIDACIQEQFGIVQEDYRVGYRIINEGHGRSETNLLAVAIPNAQAEAACDMFPAGVPAPVSVELACLAVMTAFLHAADKTDSDEAVGIIEFGARHTFFCIFYKKELVLIRKFDLGTYVFLDAIQRELGVDRETAQHIISDRSFDISQIIRDVSAPFVKQLVISRHFVERRENCRVTRVFAPSGISQGWLNEIKSAIGLDVDFWNPFDGLSMSPDVYPKEFEGQQSRFSAAVGAGLGVMEAIAP